MFQFTSPLPSPRAPRRRRSQNTTIEMDGSASQSDCKLVLYSAFRSVPRHLEPGTETNPATGSRLTEECRGRVVLAALMGEFPRDNHAALAHGYFSHESDLKLAQQYYSLCRLDKGEGSWAIESCPQELWSNHIFHRGKGRIRNPRGCD